MLSLDIYMRGRQVTRVSRTGDSQHWITVKGAPVLVESGPDGKLKIVGGAGGKLNGKELGSKAKDKPKEKKATAKPKTKARAEVKTKSSHKGGEALSDLIENMAEESRPD